MQQQKGTAAGHTIRAVDVFCAVKPQRKMPYLFKIKRMHLNQLTENILRAKIPSIAVLIVRKKKKVKPTNTDQFHVCF